MTEKKQSRTKLQILVELIKQSANRQHWNECRKHLKALCREMGQEEARRYDPGTLENALTLLELMHKTGDSHEPRAVAVHALHRRLTDYLVMRSSPQSWPILKAHLEAGVLGYPLRAAIYTPDGEPCYRLRDVLMASRRPIEITAHPSL